MFTLKCQINGWMSQLCRQALKSLCKRNLHYIHKKNINWAVGTKLCVDLSTNLWKSNSSSKFVSNRVINPRWICTWLCAVLDIMSYMRKTNPFFCRTAISDSRILGCLCTCFNVRICIDDRGSHLWKAFCDKISSQGKRQPKRHARRQDKRQAKRQDKRLANSQAKRQAKRLANRLANRQTKRQAKRLARRIFSDMLSSLSQFWQKKTKAKRDSESCATRANNIFMTEGPDKQENSGDHHHVYKSRHKFNLCLIFSVPSSPQDYQVVEAFGLLRSASHFAFYFLQHSIIHQPQGSKLSILKPAQKGHYRVVYSFRGLGCKMSPT